MRQMIARFCLLLAVLTLTALPLATLACEAQGEATPREDLPPDAVWMDVVYRSYDPDEIQVTQIMTQATGVSLREGPSAAARKIRGIPADTLLNVLDHVPGWYYVRYAGDSGYVNDSSEFVLILDCVTPQPQTPTPTPVVTPTPKPATPTPNRNPAAMAPPFLGTQVCSAGDMSMTVFWVQTQLKATGRWLQDESVTGLMDEATQAAVSALMAERGLPDHGGDIDQSVIDALTDTLGSWTVAVYTGGFYEAMAPVMDGGAEGSMILIGPLGMAGAVSSGSAVRWAQTCLSFLGYYHGSLHGEYNEATRAAVRLFNKENGFPGLDDLSLGSARALMEAYYYNRGDLGKL